jgi:transcriptional regulator GlxA family with amidase domain
LLSGRSATTHWLQRDRLGELGANVLSERVVYDGKLVTAAGVSAGIDMALSLVQREFGDQVAKAIQLSIEYDPEPPFDTGSPDKAPAETVEQVRAGARKAGER